MRGQEAKGISVSLVPQTEEGPAVALPAYSDICCECGMVTFFVRIGSLVEVST